MPLFSQTRRWGLLTVLLLTVVCWLVSPAPAAAHPKLAKSSPAAGSSVDASPKEIELYLTEGVSLEFSTIKVYDRARREQAVGPVSRIGNGGDTTARVPLLNTLPSGTYTVVWRVLSTVDGHLIAGSFAFRVRGESAGAETAGGTPETREPIVPNEESAGAPFEGSAADPSPFRWALRALMLGSIVLLLGGAALTVLVIEPTAEERGEAGAALWSVVSSRFARIGTVAAGILLVTLVVDLVMQVADIAGTDAIGALSRGDLALLIVNTTRYGFTWALKALAATVLVGLMLFVLLRRPGSKRGSSGVWEVSIAASSLLLLAQSLGSHAAAAAGATDPLGLGLPLPVVSDWLHLLAVSLWVGGLGYMALALFPAFRIAGLPPEERRAFLGRSIPRFSRVALFSVAVLAVTGTYNLLIHSTDLGAILGSRWGQILALKVGVFAVLVAIGAINLRRLSPLLRGAGSGVQSAAQDGAAVGSKPVRQMGRNIRLEAALAVVALVCAGGLTLLPPPGGGTTSAASAPGDVTPVPSESAVAQPPPPPPPPPLPTPYPTPQPAGSTTEVAGYNFALNVRPSFEGDELTLRIGRVSQASPPLTDVAKVLFKVTPQDIDSGSTSYEATREGEAGADAQTWKATETFLTLDGGYLVTAIMQRTESSDVKAAFRLDLSVAEGLKVQPGQAVDVRIATDPSPPISGTGTIRLSLVDGGGAPIEGARVTVNPFMPAHAHIEPVSVATPVPGQPGSYTSPIEFDMVGGWLFIFLVEREGLPPLKTDATLEVLDPNGAPTPQASP